MSRRTRARRHTRGGRLAASLMALLVVGAVGACGDDDEEGGAKAPPSISIEASQAGAKGPVTLRVPNSSPGGVVRIDYRNSTRGTRDLQLIRVDGKHSLQEVLKFFEQEGAPVPPWFHGGGGVGTTPPGTAGSSTQQLVPGTYYAIDTGAQEEEGESKPTGAGPLTVEGAGQGAQLPQVPAEIAALEYGFTTRGLKAGRNTIRFRNSGREPHHVIAAPYTPGSTLEDVRRFATSEREPSGPPPIQFERADGTAVLDGGTEQVTEINLTRGKNALLCFISDRRGGPPHVAKGMIVEVNVP